MADNATARGQRSRSAGGALSAPFAIFAAPHCGIAIAHDAGATCLRCEEQP
jgi:hypothetical protein